VTSIPVAFPTASRPQAWSAAAPLLLLTTLLRLEPGDDPAEAARVSPNARTITLEPAALA